MYVTSLVLEVCMQVLSTLHKCHVGNLVTIRSWTVELIAQREFCYALLQMCDMVYMHCCSALRLLDVSHNMMTGLSEELVQLQRLRVIKATHNRMAQLPPGLAQLTALQELHVAGNNLQVICRGTYVYSSAQEGLECRLQHCFDNA